MRTEFASEREKKKYFNKMTEEQKLEAFPEMLAVSSQAVFLGGAEDLIGLAGCTIADIV